MFGIGFFELIFFSAVALVVLGPEKLPKAARAAGLWYGKLRRAMNNMQSEIETELNLAEARKQMQEELEKIRAAEREMQANMQRMEKNIQDMQAHTNQNVNAFVESEHSELKQHAHDITGLVESHDNNATQVPEKSADEESMPQNALVHESTSSEPYFFRLTEKQQHIHMPHAPFLPRLTK